MEVLEDVWLVRPLADELCNQFGLVPIPPSIHREDVRW